LEVLVIEFPQRIRRVGSHVPACIAILAACGVAPVLAHQPTLSDGSATSFESALAFANPDISRVVYHTVTDDAPRIWIALEIDAPRSLLVQLAVPKVDRLSEFRPALAIVGPELPANEVPFTTPDDTGALVFDTAGQEPEVFDEPFTGTTSWIFVEEQVEFPAAGRYYLVGYAPGETTGKLWVAWGTEEAFSLQDVLGLPEMIRDVREFHEMEPGIGLPCVMLPVLGAAGFTLLIRQSRLTQHRPRSLSRQP
jgi:hypothetical protein